jgi:putative heme iron utilization protein
MNAEILQTIHRLLGGARIAALGTLREGAPFVSLTATAPSDDFTAFWLHLSRLAFHARHIEEDPRVSLMIWEDPGPGVSPLSAARISLAGEAVRVNSETAEFESGKTTFLARNPENERFFLLGDFSLYRVTVGYGRLVGGFGAIQTISPAHLREASRTRPTNPTSRT